MKKYIFLDNWVYSRLTDTDFERSLTAFINNNDFTVIFTIVSAVELFNPNWTNSGQKDRVDRTASFFNKVPCDIIDPMKIHSAELQKYLSPIDELPINLKLWNLSPCLRSKAFLNVFRHESLPSDFERMENWCETYKNEKDNWFDNKDRIINDAIACGNLKIDKDGNFTDLENIKQQFLFSLDLRMADPGEIDTILRKLNERADQKQPFKLTSVRVWSLCFWHLYIEIDNANKIRISPSDFGDLYQLSLLPYCSAFTLDGSMYRLLQRTRDMTTPINCDLIRAKDLEDILKKY
ncbi:MAG: hypothetical protein ABFD07_09160 [Methanobacterium sp.]